MRAIWAVFLICALAVPGWAEDYPFLHRVTGVAADDVLNVRDGPGASHPIVGTLAHNATSVEVVRAEGGWGLVNTGERHGWAALRFLAPEPDGSLGNSFAFTCFGTEPFWSLDVRQGQEAALRTPERPEGASFGVGLLQRAFNPLDKYVMLGQGRGTASGREIALVVTRAYCDDGMSDQQFGLDATVIVSGPNGPVLSGCCSLQE